MRDLQVPATLNRHVLGHRAGLPGLAAGHGNPAAAFDRGDLPRARHPVRELHPSADHPVGLPTAGLGALLTLMAFGIELNMYAFVGIIMLVRHREEERIMMIDFAIEAQAQGRHGPGRGDLTRRGWSASGRYDTTMAR